MKINNFFRGLLSLVVVSGSTLCAIADIKVRNNTDFTAQVTVSQVAMADKHAEIAAHGFSTFTRGIANWALLSGISARLATPAGYVDASPITTYAINDPRSLSRKVNFVIEGDTQQGFKVVHPAGEE